MLIGFRRHGDTLVVSPDCDLTFDCHQEFEELTRARLVDGVRAVVVDLGKVGHLDSSGLGAIARIHREFRPRGGSLVLAACSRDLRSLLKLAGFDRHLVLFETVDGAVASFAPPPSNEGEDV